MEDKELSPSDSLALIANVIQEAKSRFRDNGFAFIFLGSCISLSCLGQFILLQLNYFSINYYPYFIMPVAGIFTYFYYNKKKKEKRSKNIIGKVLSVYGAILGINTTVIGFFFWNQFGNALFPVMFILCAVWAILTGVILRFRILIISGLLVNIVAFITFFMKFEYHPLLMSITSLLAFVLPGIIINQSNK